VALIINEMESTVESGDGGDGGGASGGGAQSQGGGGESRDLDDEDFLLRYRTVLRAFIQDEIERYLRNEAD
jgi:hypothetical protein